MLWVVVALVVVVVVVVVVVRADADLTLTLKGAAPRSAIEGKAVWIVGASQNIGAELAREYARLGANLILTARREPELERVKASLQGAAAAVVLPGDITAPGVDELVQRAEAAFGGLDIVVLNAACPRPKASAAELPDEALRRTLEVNTVGAIRVAQRALRGMWGRGSTGQFVVVSSVAGIVPSPGQAAYCASKHALHGFFNSLRAEGGVRVTLACPGPVATPRVASEAREVALERRLPVRRCAELIVRAGAHDLMEAWICYQPILLLLYFMQYAPSLALFVVNRVGPRRVTSYSDGSLFKKSS